MIKEMLDNYMDYKAIIKTKEHEIKKLELEEVSIGGSNFSINGDIKPKGYMTTGTEEKIIKNTDKIVSLKKEIEELKAKIDMIDSLINTLSDYHREIVDLKYKYNKTDSQVATIMKREERTIRYANKKILGILEKKYNDFLKIS